MGLLKFRDEASRRDYRAKWQTIDAAVGQEDMTLRCVNHSGTALSSSPNDAMVMLMALPAMTKGALRMIDCQNYIKVTFSQFHQVV